MEHTIDPIPSPNPYASRLQPVYTTVLSDPSCTIQECPLPLNAPKAHRDVVSLVNRIVTRLAENITKHRHIHNIHQGNTPTFKYLTDRLTKSYGLARNTRELVTTFRVVERLKAVLVKPCFLRSGASEDFLGFTNQCIQAMRVDLLAHGYMDDPIVHQTEFVTRWVADGEDSRTADIYRTDLEHGLMVIGAGSPKQEPLLLRFLARTIGYRRHGWPLTTHEITDIGLDITSPQIPGKLLGVSKRQTALWKVVRNLLTIANTLSVEAGDSNAEPYVDSSRKDWATFSAASCVSPLGLLAPFFLSSEIESDVPVFQVCTKSTYIFCELLLTPCT